MSAPPRTRAASSRTVRIPPTTTFPCSDGFRHPIPDLVGRGDTSCFRAPGHRDAPGRAGVLSRRNARANRACGCASPCAFRRCPNTNGSPAAPGICPQRSIAATVPVTTSPSNAAGHAPAAASARCFPSFTLYVNVARRAVPLVSWRTTVWRLAVGLASAARVFPLQGPRTSARTSGATRRGGRSGSRPRRPPLGSMVKDKKVNRARSEGDQLRLDRAGLSVRRRAGGVHHVDMHKGRRFTYFDNGSIRTHGIVTTYTRCAGASFSHGLPSPVPTRQYDVSFVLAHRRGAKTWLQEIALGFRRTFWSRAMVLRCGGLPSRLAFYYELDLPPLPVETLEGLT